MLLHSFEKWLNCLLTRVGTSVRQRPRMGLYALMLLLWIIMTDPLWDSQGYFCSMAETMLVQKKSKTGIFGESIVSYVCLFASDVKSTTIYQKQKVCSLSPRMEIFA